MSLYGFDMLDGASLCHYMATEAEEASNTIIVDPPESFLHIVPRDIEVRDVDEESTVSNESGVLILPSVSSSECLASFDMPSAIVATSPPPLQMASPGAVLAASGQILPVTSSSIHTEASLSTLRSSLSLNPSLLPSSVASDLLSIHDSTSLMVPTAPVALLVLPKAKTVNSSGSGGEDGVGDGTSNAEGVVQEIQEWYGDMKNDFDWESLRYEIYTALQALDEPVSEELLAQLIQQEEEVFWKKQAGIEGGVVKKHGYMQYLGDTAFLMVATAVPLLGAAVLMRKSRPFFRP
jgi:hypothetical protein